MIMLRWNFEHAYKDLNSGKNFDKLFKRISFKLPSSVCAKLASFGRLIIK